MENTQMIGKWNELKGKVQANWGKLTDEDLVTIGGRLEQLKGVVQQRYGIQKDEADQKVAQFLDALKSQTKH